MKPRLILRWLRYHAVFRPIATLPADIAYRGASFIGRVDSLCDPAGRKAYSRGLAAVFPELSGKTLDHYSRLHSEMMARELLDVFRLPRIGTGLSSIGDVLGLEVLKEARKEGRGVILAMGHYGRPIMLGARLAAESERVGMVTQAVDMRNPQLNFVERGFLQRKTRNTLGVTQGSWITIDDSMRRLYTELNKGEIIAVLFDLYEPVAERRLQRPFLGGALEVPRGIERVAASCGARIIYGVATDNGGRIHAELRSLPEEPHNAFSAAVSELEKDIAKAPWQWWQWNMLDLIWKTSRNAKPCT